MDNTKRDFKKAKLLIGKQGSGKSALVNNIAKSYEYPITLDSTISSKEINLLIPVNTDLVIIDGCGEDFNFENYFELIARGIHHREEGREVLVYPHFIFTTQYIPILYSNSFEARFEILKTYPFVNWNYISQKYHKKHNHFKKWLYHFYFKDYIAGLSMLMVEEFSKTYLYIQWAIFSEYLKSDEVTFIEVNTLNEMECVKFIEEYFKTQSEVSPFIPIDFDVRTHFIEDL